MRERNCILKLLLLIVVMNNTDCFGEINALRNSLYKVRLFHGIVGVENGIRIRKLRREIAVKLTNYNRGK